MVERVGSSLRATFMEEARSEHRVTGARRVLVKVQQPWSRDP